MLPLQVSIWATAGLLAKPVSRIIGTVAIGVVTEEATEEITIVPKTETHMGGIQGETQGETGGTDAMISHLVALGIHPSTDDEGVTLAVLREAAALREPEITTLLSLRLQHPLTMLGGNRLSLLAPYHWFAKQKVKKSTRKEEVPLYAVVVSSSSLQISFSTIMKILGLRLFNKGKISLKLSSYLVVFNVV